MFFRKNRLIILLLALLFAAMSVIIPYLIFIYDQPETVVPEAPPPPEPKMEFGIAVDTLTLMKGIVRKDQSLSDILSFYKVPGDVIHNLASISRPVFDVRKMRTGNPYTLMFTREKKPELLYFIYEEDAISYITFGFRDKLTVKRDSRPVDRITRSASGVIESSLWNSMVDQGTDPNLAIEMSEVYAWTIDFFGIQEGDYYKVLYEDLVVEGKSIGIGKILAASFNHMGADIYAFRFSYLDQTGYYDEKAQNLQKAFLKAPLRFKRISSGFSHGRMHPILKIRRPHLGVDYAADAGTPVQSIGDGTVIDKGWDKKGGGNYIKIRHNATYTTLYMHLQGFARGLSTGSRVRQGEVIGYVGSTGLSTGPHLDFRFFRNGQPIDPLKVESPPAEPVPAAYLPDYTLLKDSLKTGLDTLVVLGFEDPMK
jgi:murein DD-endopeptidase MepM/ murein hydrolase activator NlpD